MAFDISIIPVSVNKDVILAGDFFFDPIEGKNIYKTKIKDDQGKESVPLRSDFKMTDLQFSNYNK